MTYIDTYIASLYVGTGMEVNEKNIRGQVLEVFKRSKKAIRMY